LITPIFLVGGSGQRLWPLSRSTYPKQFIEIYGGKSLLQHSVDRFFASDNLSAEFNDPVFLANEDHRFILEDQLKSSSINSYSVILEPTGKNTLPAVILGSLLARDINPGSKLLVIPTDHFMDDPSQLINFLSKVSKENLKGVIAFGIETSKPDVNYGYILKEKKQESDLGLSNISEFIEKPNIDIATDLHLNRDCFYNSGMFLLSDNFLEEDLQYENLELLETINSIWKKRTKEDFVYKLPKEDFLKIKAISFDYGVMERAKNCSMLELKTVWSDLGTWKSIREFLPNNLKNIPEGNIQLYDSNNNYIKSNKLTIGLGIENLLVVDTQDALLVASQDKAEQVKDIVADLQARDFKEATENFFEYRPWGRFDNLHENETYKVKKLTVNPNSKLSLQKHSRRSEHWVVVSGKAHITLESDVIELNINESIFIPQGSLHSIENKDKELLEIIEVQTGDYLGEDDIERFEDDYGRV